MKTYQHFDYLGREVAVNDVVAFSAYVGGLSIGRVDKLNRVRIKVSRLGNFPDWARIEENIPSNETVKIDSKDVEFYLLKGAK